MEQLDQLDDHRRSLRPVAAVGRAGHATEVIRLKARGDL